MSQKSFLLAKVLLISHLTASLIMNSVLSSPRFDDENEIIRNFIFSSSRKLWLDVNSSQNSNGSNQGPTHTQNLPMIPIPFLSHRTSISPGSRRIQKFYYLPQDRFGSDQRFDPYSHHPGPAPIPPGYPWDHDEHEDDLEKSFIHYIFPTILVSDCDNYGDFPESDGVKMTTLIIWTPISDKCVIQSQIGLMTSWTIAMRLIFNQKSRFWWRSNTESRNNLKRRLGWKWLLLGINKNKLKN